MTHTTRTGRSLDVSALTNAKTKVTLAFKCEAKLKMDLAIESERYTMSLSEYVEVLVAKRHENISETECMMQLEKLKARLSFYENEKLKKLFDKYKGRTIPYRDENSIEREATINSIQDLYLQIMQSLKL